MVYYFSRYTCWCWMQSAILSYRSLFPFWSCNMKYWPVWAKATWSKIRRTEYIFIKAIMMESWELWRELYHPFSIKRKSKLFQQWDSYKWEPEPLPTNSHACLCYQPSTLNGKLATQQTYIWMIWTEEYWTIINISIQCQFCTVSNQ